MSEASEVELLMLELINEERTSRGLDPLLINNALNDASEDHTEWMLDTDTFSHTGAGSSSATDRIRASDYELEGSWRTAENIGWQSERGDPGIADDVASIHESLMNSPGHRANLLNPDLRDIGIGIETGDFRGYDAVMVTQNFGRTDAVIDAPDPTPEPPVAETDDIPGPILTDFPETDGPTDDDTPEPTEEPDVAEVPEEETPEPTEDPDVPEIPDETETDGECPADDDVDDDDDGNAVTVETTRVVNTVTETTITPEGQDPITVTTDETVTSELTSDGDDFFIFCETDDAPDMDDIVTATLFEGTITTSEGTFETQDWAEFNAMLAELLEPFGGFTCGMEMEFV